MSALATLPTRSVFRALCTKNKLPLMLASLVDLLCHKWWGLLDFRREIKQYQSQRVRTSFLLVADILSALDTQCRVGMYWIEDTARIPYWEKGSPFLAILSWWTELMKRQYVHAGAVGNRTGGVPTAIIPKVLLPKRIHDANISLNVPENNRNLLQALKQSIDRKRAMKQ